MTIEIILGGSKLLANIRLSGRVFHPSQDLMVNLQRCLVWRLASLRMRLRLLWINVRRMETGHCLCQDLLLPSSRSMPAFLRRKLWKYYWFTTQADISWSCIVSLSIYQSKGLPLQFDKVDFIDSSLLTLTRIPNIPLLRLYTSFHTRQALPILFAFIRSLTVLRAVQRAYNLNAFSS